MILRIILVIKFGIYNKDLNNLIDDKKIILALFTDLKTGKKIGFAKYIKEDGNQWKQSDSSNSCFKKMYSYIYANKAGQSNEFGMRVSDLIGNDQYNINEIINIITNNINKKDNVSNDFKSYLIMLLKYFSSDDVEFPEKELTIYEKNYICNVFGEILGIIAILHHKNIKDIDDKILNKINEETDKIEFNKTGGKLTDSNIICSDGTIIGVSSKHETGGRASITGLMDRINSLNENDKKYFLNEIEVFNIINKGGQYIAPIELLSLLYKSDSNFKKYFYKIFNVELNDKIISELINLYNKGFDEKKLKDFNPSELIKKIKLVDINAPYKDFFNIIAGITKCVVQYLNMTFKFNKFINKLLKENFIQIHLSSKEQIIEDKIILKNIFFKIKNLENIEYNAKLNSGSNYQSNKCQGKIKFEINSKVK